MMPDRKLVARRAILGAGFEDATAGTATTRGAPLSEIIGRLLERRDVLKGSAAAGIATFVGLAGCEDEPGFAELPGPASTSDEPILNFESIASSGADTVSVPAGHKAQVLYAYGDPLDPSLGPFSNAGTEPALEFDRRAGDHHDGMYFFGMDANGSFDPGASGRGILCINHENVTQSLMHANGPTLSATNERTDADEVRKEQRSHGVSCIEVSRDAATGRFTIVADSPFNRRITTLDRTVMSGPAATSPLLQTAFSPTGVAGRGTLNNCANGFTPWGTYLTCEENFDLYFRDRRAGGDPANATPAVLGFDKYLAGIGVREPDGLYGWADLAGDPSEFDNEFARFNVEPTGADATQDFRNEGNQYGYVVEIDPFDPAAAPRKRTALGRFAHEGVWPSNIETGSPVVFYMGDDDRFQYIYKFVSDTLFDGPSQGESPLETGDPFLDNGTLFVARFDVDSATDGRTGMWLALTPDNPDLQAASAPGAQFEGLFSSLDSIVVHARGAAFAAGATPMDRPEWGAVNPLNGEAYFTLTNNSDRREFDDGDPAAAAAGDRGTRDEVAEFLADREFGVVAANPRGPNSDGHIIRLRENGDDPAALGFAWEIFVFGSGLGDATNFSSLTAANEFTDCDGLWFDPRGLLWIQTDGGQPTGNNQMLTSVPGVVGDGGITAANNAARLRRFLVGPVDCEITGICMTPDRTAMFVNIQHPGDDDDADPTDPGTFTSNWPNDNRDGTTAGEAGVRARSATLVITRDDGGALGTD